MFNIIYNSFCYNWEFLLRIIIAAVCGGVIGYERSRRQKEAGLRTHVIVALGSALIMIVSMYGCLDVKWRFGIDFDSSRIAASIVSGIGFLGAGVIFIRSMSVKGLTTAAGIWTTSGVGMAIGSGMYAVGIFSTIMIVLFQLILHKWIPYASSETSTASDISATLPNNGEALENFMNALDKNNISVNDFGVSKNSDENTITLKLSVRMSSESSVEEIIEFANSVPDVIKLKVNC